MRGRTRDATGRYRDVAAPAVSVITPAFDVAPWIGDAIASIRAQSRRDWEMLVVDDGSRDGTADVAESARGADARIRILRQANAGVAAARTAGIAASTGERLLFLDADDWVAPDALARLTSTLDAAPGAVAAYGPWAAMAGEARPSDRPLRLKTGPFPAGDILPQLLVQNLLANGGHALIRRTAFEQAGGFDPRLSYGEDWECWIRLALVGDWARVPGDDPLLFMRERAGSAYRRLAHDPAAFLPAMRAIWGNPLLAERLGPRRTERLRRRAEAENDWVVGKEMIRHGQVPGGLAKLRDSVAAAPSGKRAVLLAAAHALPMLPARLHGPFRRYPA